MEAIFGDLLKSLMALGGGGVLAAVMAYLWKIERDERREVQGMKRRRRKRRVNWRL